ncbi:MAG TPA: hypothetical protein ENN21_02865 [Spirochaetes bacterium]|nr:hypothetical protein [Spirochaetota bacterium]
MKKSLLLILVSAFFIGCFATMPPPVKEMYLKDTTADEQKKLSAIEQEIIKINQENSRLKESLKILNQKILVNEKDIARLEKEKSYFAEKEKLLTLSNETEKLVKLNEEKKKNDFDLQLEKLNLDFLKAKKNCDEVNSELLNTRLNVKIAELNFEKAKIGRAYQDKTLGPVVADAKGGKDKNRIDIEQYEKYYKDQQAKLEQKQKELKRYEDVLKQAEEKYKSFKSSAE